MDGNVAVLCVRKGDRVGIVKRVLLVIAHDVRAVNGGIQQTDHRQGNYDHRADGRSRCPNLLVSEDQHGIEDDRAGAEQRDQNVLWQVELEIRKVRRVGCGGQRNHRQKDQIPPPFVLFHIVADIAHRQAKNRPDKPIPIVLEQTPALPAEGYLDQIDQRLADQKENEAFQCGIEVRLAVQDDEDAEQNPHLKGRRDRMEGSIEQRRDDRYDGGQYTGDYGEQNQLRPGQINPAEEFLNQFFHVQSISF